ncbi:MAG: AraC family transcriptional regulator [Paenibacillaceae bacterium]|jgi:AraC-like DNA-binding protein|nr:AraC family transcriptional regulator [Paenibacillaceae bacterium]
MLYPHHDHKLSSFGFSYFSRPGIPMQLMNIGWERVTTTNYRWEGLNRGKGIYTILQITLSGRGAIRFGDKTHDLTKDTGFLIVVPSDHVYYFPEDAGHWEFLYVVVRGNDAVQHWSYIIDKLGPIVDFRSQPNALLLLSKLYADIYNDPQMDKYLISSRLYDLFMELHRMADGFDQARQEQLPDAVSSAINFMQSRYATDLSLDDIVDHTQLSKYHFSRMFKKVTGLSPNRYLRKIRVEKAAWLLRHTAKTLDVIAHETGFDNSNYLIKVFRSFVGVTPNDYRLGKKISPVEFLRIET